jgi:glycopeptide antibiotics resistance protein
MHNAVATGPDLEIPKRFTVLHKTMLRSVFEEFDPSWNYLDDLLRNIAGFMPVGFIFGAYFLLARSRFHAILYATLAGGALSFVVEVLQAYIPPRGSGVTDIITNTLGSALGAVLARPALVEGILRKLHQDADR